jgi:hypothetical protein
VSSGYISAKDESGPDEILEAMRKATFDNPRLTEMPAEELSSSSWVDACRRSFTRVDGGLSLLGEAGQEMGPRRPRRRYDRNVELLPGILAIVWVMLHMVG